MQACSKALKRYLGFHFLGFGLMERAPFGLGALFLCNLFFVFFVYIYNFDLISGEVAQVVEQRPEQPRVARSTRRPLHFKIRDLRITR